MINYVEILRLHYSGVSIRSIAVSLPHSRNTISNVIKRSKELGIEWPLPEEMTNQKLKSVLFPENKSTECFRQPDFDYIHAELAKSGVTITLLWHEYSVSSRDSGLIPYKYSQFCKLYHDYASKTKATMRIRHKPGEKLEVDWAGQTAKVQDNITGKPLKAYIFVAVLPYSGYAYVEAFADMRLGSWIRAHINCFNYLGGVSKILVPDNLKTGVQYANWYNPMINSTYNEMAVYYDTVVIPARVRKPKDKASVEGSVGLISTWLLAALRDLTFFSYAELNKEIMKRLKEVNNKPFQKKEGSRASIFFAEEKKMLTPLPTTPYEPAIWSKARVQYDYHICFDKVYYSVPYEYIKHEVDIKATKSLIEVYYNSIRIAIHPRKFGSPGTHQTILAHMPENHRKYQELSSERLIIMAESIGNNTVSVVKSILKSAKVERQGYRSCLALLKSAEKYGELRLEAACGSALAANPRPDNKAVQLILKSGVLREQKNEEQPNENTESEYAITRGSEYYARIKR